MNKLEDFRSQLTVESFQGMLRNKDIEESRIKTSAFIALAHSTEDQLIAGLPADLAARVKAYSSDRRAVISKFIRSLDQLSDLSDDLLTLNQFYQDYKKSKRLAAKAYWSLQDEMTPSELMQWETEVPEIGAFAKKLTDKNTKWKYVEPCPLDSFNIYLRDLMKDCDLINKSEVIHVKLQALLCFCLTRVNLTEEQLMHRFDDLHLSDKEGAKKKALLEQLPLAKQKVVEFQRKYEAEKEERIAVRKSVLLAQLKIYSALAEPAKMFQDYKDYRKAKERSLMMLRALALFCNEKELISHPNLSHESRCSYYAIRNKFYVLKQI